MSSNRRKRVRKNKGNFSVLSAFQDDEGGHIDFKPELADEVANKIEKRSHSADSLIESKISSQENKSSSKVVAKNPESSSKVVASESGSKVVAKNIESSSKVVAGNTKSGSKVVASKSSSKVVARNTESSSKVVASESGSKVVAELEKNQKEATSTKSGSKVVAKNIESSSKVVASKSGSKVVAKSPESSSKVVASPTSMPPLTYPDKHREPPREIQVSTEAQASKQQLRAGPKNQAAPTKIQAPKASLEKEAIDKPKAASTEDKDPFYEEAVESFFSEVQSPERPTDRPKTEINRASDDVRKTPIVAKKVPESGSKVVANKGESGSETSSKVVASKGKSSSKVVAKWKQSGSKNTKKMKFDALKFGESGSKVVAKWKQSSSESGSKSGSESSSKSSSKNRGPISYFHFYGLQKRVLHFIFDKCLDNGSQVTPPITVKELTSSLETSSGTVKNAIIRLCEKRAVAKYNYKDGRGGWTQYWLEDNIYNEMLKSEINPKSGSESSSKSGSESSSKSGSKPGSSSSSYIYNNNIYNNKTTTTSGPSQEQNPSNETQQYSALRNVRFSGLEQYGFHEGKLKQIYKRNIFSSLEQLQQTIDHLEFYLKSDESKGINEPLGWIMKQLNQGHFPRPRGYKDPRELALEKFLAEKSQEDQRLKKLQSEAWDKAHNELKEDYRDKVREDLEQQFGPEGAKVLVEQEAKKLFLTDLEFSVSGPVS